MASGRRANDAMVSAKPYVDTVNWTKGIHHEDFTHCDWLVSSNTHTITDLYFTDIFIRGKIGGHRLLLPANIES